ncbi:MAG TPA: MMPL family transporter [Mycobacteriales bacterium]
MLRHRLLVLAGSVLSLSVIALPALGGSRYGGDFVPQGEARRAAELVAAEHPGSGGSSFRLVFTTAAPVPDRPAFEQAVTKALAAARQDPRVTATVGPFDPGHPADEAGVTANGRTAFATVHLRDDVRDAALYYREIRDRIPATGLTVLGTGDVATSADLSRNLDADLARAELISFPVALILLLLVFGTVVAAVLPLAVGALAVAAGSAITVGLSRVVTVSDLTLSVVSLLGLGLAVDYSLFVVSRFREELDRGASTADAVVTTVSVTGRTVLFSGLTVLAGLSGLLLFPGSFLPGMGLAAGAVVLCAVAYALTFLPAALALLGPRVNRLRVLPHRPGQTDPLWTALAHGVMRRRWLALPVIGLLLLVGVPFLQLHIRTDDVGQLPAGTEARSGDTLLTAAFPALGTADILAVVRFPDDPLGPAHVAALHQLSRTVAALPDVEGVDGVVDRPPGQPASFYQRLYADPGRLPAPSLALVRQTVGPHTVVLRVHSPAVRGSDEARTVVHRIRSIPAPGDAELLVTGQTAAEADVAGLISRWTPWAVAAVIALVYLVLLGTLRSILLPAKAVVMTLLSITASFGALVWVFQDGHLAGALGVTPAGGIDPAVPVLLFCLAFGLSMDYEVLLLSRTQEAYLAGGDNRTAVAEGLRRSGRLITGAAVIMVAVFASFSTGGVVLVKAVGLGLALAVAVDATLVRCVAVPALMALFGRANWWAPGRIGHPGLRRELVPQSSTGGAPAEPLPDRPQRTESKESR